MTESAPSVLAKNVESDVEGRTILADVCCTFPGSVVTGLVGQNGSGKSTLMRILARQVPATRGQVSYGDEALASLSTRSVSRKIAYMPQNVPAAPGMTVRELVSIGRYPWHGALGRFTDRDAEAVDRALRITKTDTFADRILDNLSGGERQRCWLAMLIAQQAKMLMLDEPTSALDLGHQHAILSLLKQLSRDTKIGAIVILHDINLAAQYCDRIIALSAGRVVAEGTPAEIMTPEQLSGIFGIPMLVAPHPGTKKPYCYAALDEFAPTVGVLG